MNGHRGSQGLVLAIGLLVFLPLAYVLADGLGLFGGTLALNGLFTDDVPLLLANSLWVALFAALFATALGLPLAYWLQMRDFPLRKQLGWAYILPLLIPPHIHTIAWNRVIGNQGWLTAWFEQSATWGSFVALVRDTVGVSLWTSIDVRAALMGRADIEHPLYPLLGSIYLGPAWIMGCAFFPLVTLAASAGLRALDGEGLLAARLTGRRGLFRTLILPQIRGRVLSGALFVFVLALSTYPVVSLLNTPTLIQKVFVVFSQTTQEGGALLGLLLVVVAALAVFVIAQLEPQGVRQGQAEPAPVRCSAWTTVSVLLVLGLGFGLPFASLVAEAGPISLDPKRLDNYQSVFARGGIPEAFADSLLMGVTGALILVLIAWPIARAAREAKSTFVEGLGLSILAVPSVLTGVILTVFWTDLVSGAMPDAFLIGLFGLLFVAAAAVERFRREALVRAAVLSLAGLALLYAVRASPFLRRMQEEGLTLVWLAFLALFLPFVLRLFRQGYRALDPDEAHAGRLSGRSVLVRIFRLEAPRLRPVIFGSLVLGWVLCFTELAASLVVMRPGWQSVQLRIFNMVHYRSIGEVSALCVMVILFAVLPVILLRLAMPERRNVL